MDEASIFVEALQQTTPEERAVFLDQACAGNDELRHNVDMLLKAHAKAGDYLNQPAVAMAATTDGSTVTEGPGAAIGPYKLLEQIGEGGFGVVYLAEQTTPVRRKVALKVLKLGMDTRQVVARFDAERQALAIMDHPNIARVFDGGVTPSGRPFFVMELVKGLPITEFCDQHKLTTQQRLELFVDVCQAVQHAHQKGIIHRDIKPSNVLVSRHDTTPVVKVIDFGVAKALGQELTDKTLFTGIAQMIGTPLYMSPEQAGKSDLDVDTRSDVYSLGVLLYELLTGATPFSKERFKQAAYDEIRRIIREEDPPRPSTRISESTETLPSVAANRGVEPRRLGGLMRGELDWIVMKALEKDRNRRYETANGFAMDVQRYLAGEVVQACPPSAVYRFKKFVRRNKTVVIASGLVVSALVAGVVGTTIGMLEARTARVAEALRAEGEREAKLLAEANFAIASEAVEKYLGTVTNDRSLKRDDFTGLRKKLLESAIPFYQRLIDQKSDDPKVEFRRGQAHGHLGEVRRYLGDQEAALRDFEAARTIFARLSTAFPDVGAYQDSLTMIHDDIGTSLLRRGKHAEAEAAYLQALDIGTKLAARFPGERMYESRLASVHGNLGALLSEVGRRPEAKSACLRAVGILEKLVARYPKEAEYQLKLGGQHCNLGGNLLKLKEKHEDAEAHLRQALEIQTKLVDSDPEEPEYLRAQAGTLTNLGHVLGTQRKRQAAEAVFLQALNIWNKLTTRFPTVPEYGRDLALGYDSLGSCLAGQGKQAEAESAHLRGLEIRAQLADGFPSMPQYAVELGSSYLNYGSTLFASGRHEQALDWLTKAVARFKPLVARYDRLMNARMGLRNSHYGRAQALDALSRRNEATPDYEQALKFDDGTFGPTIRVWIARNKKDAAACLAATAAYEKQSGFVAKKLYGGAALFRVACAEAVQEDPKTPRADVDRLVKEQTDLAMDWLHKAVAARNMNLWYLKIDPRFKPLHNRDDFKKLIADLEAKKK